MTSLVGEVMQAASERRRRLADAMFDTLSRAVAGKPPASGDAATVAEGLAALGLPATALPKLIESVGRVVARRAAQPRLDELMARNKAAIVAQAAALGELEEERKVLWEKTQAAGREHGRLVAGARALFDEAHTTVERGELDERQWSRFSEGGDFDAAVLDRSR